MVRSSPIQGFRRAFLLAGEQVLTIITSQYLFRKGVVVKVRCVRCRWAAQEENAFASQEIESVMFARRTNLRCFRHRQVLLPPPHDCAIMAGRSTQHAATEA
jgi:hypothetical protein